MSNGLLVDAGYVESLTLKSVHVSLLPMVIW